MLIEAHADITQSCTTEESTPLHEAIKFPQNVKILVDHGANINKEAADGQTPLSLAVLLGHKETVKLMLANPKNTADFSLEQVQNALAYAVVEDHVEIVAELLEAGADVNLVNNDWPPMICSAMGLERPAMLRVLLEHNPDLTKTDSKGNMVLHYIDKLTPVESARLAVNAGASMTAVNNDQSPPLCFAIYALCKEEVLQYLLSKDATLASLAKPPSGDAYNPIHAACQISSLPIVQMLLEKGADINMTSEGALGTPLISATLRVYQKDLDKAEKVICFLLDKGGDPELRAGLFSYPIISACLAGSSKIVQHILDRNVPLNVKDDFDRTPAHLACYNSREVLDLLQIPDSDFACVDKVGRVPLHYAVLSGQADLVKVALERSKKVGISIDVQDSDGWTPLLWAARASAVWKWEDRPVKHDEVVSLLLDMGAGTDTHGRGPEKPWNALDVAYYHQANRYVSPIQHALDLS